MRIHRTFTHPRTGETWRVRWSPHIYINGEDRLGVCDHPGRTIWIHTDLKDNDYRTERLAVLIEELWHSYKPANYGHRRFDVRRVFREASDMLIAAGVIRP